MARHSPSMSTRTLLSGRRKHGRISTTVPTVYISSRCGASTPRRADGDHEQPPVALQSAFQRRHGARAAHIQRRHRIGKSEHPAQAKAAAAPKSSVCHWSYSHCTSFAVDTVYYTDIPLRIKSMRHGVFLHGCAKLAKFPTRGTPGRHGGEWFHIFPFLTLLQIMVISAIMVP